MNKLKRIWFLKYKIYINILLLFLKLFNTVNPIFLSINLIDYIDLEFINFDKSKYIYVCNNYYTDISIIYKRKKYPNNKILLCA